MPTVDEIKIAIESLEKDEYAILRDWFDKTEVPFI